MTIQTNVTNEIKLVINYHRIIHNLAYEIKQKEFVKRNQKKTIWEGKIQNKTRKTFIEFLSLWYQY